LSSGADFRHKRPQLPMNPLPCMATPCARCLVLRARMDPGGDNEVRAGRESHSAKVGSSICRVPLILLRISQDDAVLVGDDLGFDAPSLRDGR
jgi:hypothetical protein